MVEEATTPVEVEPGRLVLLALPPDADAEVEAASRQHVEGRGRLGEDDRTAERGKKDAGREAHAFGDPGDDAQGRHRLEPVPVGAGGLAAPALTSDLGTRVGVELLTEHHVVREDEPVDADAVVQTRGVEQRAPACRRVVRVRDERRRELRERCGRRRRRHAPAWSATGRGATVTDGIESVAPPLSTASTTATRCSTSISEPLR